MAFPAFASFINFVCAAALGIFTFLRCPNRKLGRAYALLNVCISCWGLCTFLALMMPTHERALILWKCVSVTIIWINQAFLYFSLTFLKKISQHRLLLRSVGVINVFFCGIILNGSFISKVGEKFG